MKSTTDCIYCYLRQSVNCMRHAGTPESDQPAVLYELMDMIRNLDTQATPCLNSTYTINKTYELCKNPDPFIAEKKESNENALELLPKVMKMIDPDNIHDLLILSSAGNIIDTGIIFEYDIEHTINETIKHGFSVDYFKTFKKKLENSHTVLYLGDNCGEIVFDMPVVRFLADLGKQVYYAVKSAPILNDALLEDALFAGIDKYAQIIETGSGYLGVSPENSSPEFMEILNAADLIISKGQANFESLDEYPGASGHIFFILKIKCDRVADLIEGSKFGDSVLYTIPEGGLK